MLSALLYTANKMYIQAWPWSL